LSLPGNVVKCFCALFIYLFKKFEAHITTRYKVKAKTKNRLELHGNHRTQKRR